MREVLKIKKGQRLSEADMKRLAYQIGKPVYKFFLKTVSNEISPHELKGIDINDLVNLFLLIITNIDANLVTFIKDYYRNKTGVPIDMPRLISSYITNLNETLLQKEVGELQKIL